MSSYNQSESARVSAVAEASELLRELAPPGRVKDQLRAITGLWPRWSWTKTRDVFYRDARYSVTEQELADLRILVAARKEHRGLIERIERLEAAILFSSTNVAGAQDRARQQVGRDAHSAVD